MCQPKLIDLPANRTHKTRRCHWMPRPAAGVGGVLGVATVACGQNTQEVASYEVCELADPDGRLFLLKKVAVADRELPEDEQVAYAVLLNANGQDNRCTCPGWAYGRGRDCRHLSVVKELAAAGDLDPMADAPAGEPHPTPEQVEADDRDGDLPPCFRDLGPRSSFPSNFPF